MKNFLLFILSVFMTVAITAQTTLISEDFESFTNGQKVAQNDASGFWTTWSNAPGGAEDAVISNVQNHTTSGANSMLVSGVNDMILLLGNKTSGVYEINFWYFVPTGMGAYFNFQHYEAPGNEWAVEVYFGNTGSGRVVQNGDHAFTYNQNEWVLITTTIDLDSDLATMTIGGNLIHSWPFSQQADGTAGTLQLGGINFYAGSETGETPQYYVDDIEYIEASGGANPPEVAVDITDITTDGLSDQTFNISNLGEQDLVYNIYVTYPDGSVKKSGTEKQVLLYSAKDSNPKDGTLTHVQSALTSGVGFASNVTVRSAAYFETDVVNPFIGMELTSVIIGIYNLPGSNSTSMMVWDIGSTTTPGPGALLDEVSFTPAGEQSQNTVTLTSPIYLDGSPIWFGFQCDNLTSTFPIAIDAGPRIPGVNWLSAGPGWNEMNGTIAGNIFIVGNLVGNAAIQWLSVTPNTGTLTGGTFEQITASFDLTSLDFGTYSANINVASNDQTNEYVVIPVTLTISNGVNDIKTGIMTFPNPVSDIFSIVSDSKINTVTLTDLTGKVVRNMSPQTNSYTFDMSSLGKGIYMVKIETDLQTTTRKIVVN
jgi:hypothetical protein